MGDVSTSLWDVDYPKQGGYKPPIKNNKNFVWINIGHVGIRGFFSKLYIYIFLPKKVNLHEFTLKQKFPKISQLFCQRNNKVFWKKTLVGMAWSSSIKWKVENITSLQLVFGIFLLFETILVSNVCVCNKQLSPMAFKKKAFWTFQPWRCGNDKHGVQEKAC